jgi:hypothetical protein
VALPGSLRQTISMIIYNVTVKVDHSIRQSWLQWLKDEHIPGIIATGCFTHAVILHLLESDDEEGVTYAIQYHATDTASYNRYIEQFADVFRQKGLDKWGNKFIAFRTVMQVVN